MKILTISVVRWILILIVTLETVCTIYLTQYHLEFINYTTIAYLISGLLIGFIPLFQYYDPSPLHKSGNMDRVKQICISVFFIVGVAYTAYYISPIFGQWKIDYHDADMIPQIKVSCQRWLSGEEVYKPIPEIWNGFDPTYLPLMWMPYAPLQALNIDVRWTTVFFYLAGIGLALLILMRSPTMSWLQLVPILLLMWYLISVQTGLNSMFFTLGEEGIVVGYYLLLGYALNRNNPWLIGIAITCCLLSRYLLIFWIPAFLVFYFFVIDRRKALIAGSIILVLTIVIFVIPFFIDNPRYFTSLPGKYADLLEKYWINMQDRVSVSLGLAKFFSIDQFRLLHNIEIISAAAVPPVFYGALYFFRRSSKIHVASAGICGLKVTMTFFYNFLGAPYFFYLYMVPALFSYAVLFHFLTRDRQLQVNELRITA